MRIFQRHGIPVCFKDFAIQNIVASANVGFHIKLQELAAAFGCYVSFEPELFPGLIFRTIKPKLVFLIFRSGKCVITGAKNVAQIEATYTSLYKNIIQNYRDTDDSTSSSSVYRAQIKDAWDLDGL